MTFEAMLQAEFGAQFEAWRSRLPDLKIPNVAPDGYNRRDLAAITAISIHHAAADPTVRPDAIHRFHQSASGPNAPLQSPGIAYHIYLYKKQTSISLDWRWIVAYTGDIATVRWHTASNNGYTFGICAGGNYEQQAPPWEVVNLLQRAIAVVKTFLARPLDVKPHRAFPNTSTSCPGTIASPDVWGAVLQVPAPKPAPNPYQFVLGFKAYADAHPEVGQAVEAEWFPVDPAGKQLTIQRTDKGCLFYTPETGVKFGKYQ